ncbi:MAG: regulatory protein RecX [Eubacteriales bacterium]|nr:regulatory protein RecX [Eubacteriales bacterium]
MVITAVEPRRKSLSALFIDGEFAMKLDTATLLENRISPGLEITDEQLHELIFKSDLRRAKEKAMWLISYRDHTTAELLKKLKKDFSEEASKAAVERMVELHLMNDEDVAKRYASDLRSIKHLSPQSIKYKLIEKGIDKETAEVIVEELSIDPVEEITILIEKKYSKNLRDEKGIKRTFAALQRCGYHYGDIKSALRPFLEDIYD